MEVKKINGYSLKDETSRRELNKIKSSLDVYFLSYGRGISKGSYNLGDCIVILGSKNIIIDLGRESNCQTLIQFLNEKGVSKIDYIFISHYHSDHIGGDSAEGLQTLIASNINLSECTVYLPHKNIIWNSFIGDSYVNPKANETSIKSMLSSHNIEYIEPNENEALIIDENTRFTFNNMNTNDYDEYYNHTINWNLSDLEKTIYNNFSMVVTLKHFDNYFMFAGDIEPLAESKLYKLFQKCDVLKVEHHGLNYNSDINYLSELNPKYAILCDLDENTDYELSHNTINMLYSKGCEIYRTYTNGYICVKSKFNKINVDAIEKMKVSYNNYSLYHGNSISKNSDLNDITSVGIYTSPNASTSNSLMNTPIKGSGFKLIVEKTGISNNHLRQTIINGQSQTPCIFIRNMFNDSWDEWKVIKPSINFSCDETKWNLIEGIEIDHSNYNENVICCVNDVINFSVQFETNVEITSYSVIFEFPDVVTDEAGNEHSFSSNRLVNFILFDMDGNIYPVYFTNGTPRVKNRTKIPANKTLYGSISFNY